MFRKFILVVMSCSLLLSLSACSGQKDPWAVANQYVDSWVARDYEAMYEMISTEGRENLSFEAFKKTYEDFYTGANVKSISVENLGDKEKVKGQGEEETDVDIPIQVSLESDYVGEPYTIDLSLVKEEEEKGKFAWHIRWDYPLVYVNLQQGDSIVTRSVFPKRGEILDRNGSKLAENSTVIQVGIVPGRLGGMKEEVVAELAKTFDLSEDYINERLNLEWVKEDSFVDIVNISKEELPKIEEIHAKNQGATYKEIDGRVYPYKEATAHLTGYTGYASKEELKDLEEQGFTENSKFGKTGLEKVFDERLRGVPGKKVMLVSENGTEKDIFYEVKAKDGEDITLTIDAQLQKKLYESMNNEKGTASTVNYGNGEVLAMVSSPSYDPNSFSLGMSAEELAIQQEDERNPLLNRFTKTYSPGSIFKPITAAIALDEKVIDRNYAIDVKGNKWQKDSSWGNYFITRVTDPGEPVDLEKAMVYSDNIYFGQVALKIGEENFAKGARKFGVGEDLSVRYSMGKSQLVNEGQFFTEPLLADTGYGQGQVLVNILNMPKAYSAFVNDGNIVEPKLILDDEKPTTRLAVSKEVADEIFDLMVKVVEDPKGTGHDAYIEGKTLAGKTGTAEVSNENDSGQKDELGWFSVIDKSQDTPYITTMMVEDVQGRGGSHVVIPLVRGFINSYSF